MRHARTLTRLSIGGYLLMVISILGLGYFRCLFSWAPWVIALQVAAVGLMVWARATFKLRSFHAAANPTPGGLVTTGPFRYIRNPIYASVLLFAASGALAQPSLPGALWLAVLGVGVALRVGAEERLLTEQYPDYPQYARSTKRFIPFVF